LAKEVVEAIPLPQAKNPLELALQPLLIAIVISFQNSCQNKTMWRKVLELQVDVLT
jgi:hypothetical protein